MPRIEKRQAKLPKEVIEIEDTLRLGYGEDGMETLQLPESAMEESLESHSKKAHDILLEEFKKDPEVKMSDSENVAKLHHDNRINCLVICKTLRL